MIGHPEQPKVNPALRALRRTVLRYRRLIVAMAVIGLLAGYLVWALSPKFYYARARVPFVPLLDPADAADDADRDIRAGYIQFYAVPGIARDTPGIPAKLMPLANQYPSLTAGVDYGCSSIVSEKDRKYARRYNLQMMRHVLSE
jgi:hypothetical protein